MYVKGTQLTLKAHSEHATANTRQNYQPNAVKINMPYGNMQ